MNSKGGKRRSEHQFVGTNTPSPHVGDEGGPRPTKEVGDLVQDVEEFPAESPVCQSMEATTSSLIHPSFGSIVIPVIPVIPIYKKRKPVSDPPVTKTTLSELDVNKIVNNPKLRHDINFDPDLHFRPNLDGEKGRRKQQKAHEFWETMKAQLRDFITDPERFEREVGDVDWVLPTILRVIREILETLVPERDRPAVEETFNVELLMQQFQKGVADMVRLSSWLSQLLKCHCAPMRDDLVDEMVNQLSEGDKKGDVAMLAEGLKNLLAVLEAMKLDVANHQIRCLRPLLIDDTVHFEQNFFRKKMAVGRVDIAGARAWFDSVSSPPDALSKSARNSSREMIWDFMEALVKLILPSKPPKVIPHTFLFDEERLMKLRSDFQDLINLEICMYLHRSLEASSPLQDRRSGCRDEVSQQLSASTPYYRAHSPADGIPPPSFLVLPHHFATTRPLHTPPSVTVPNRQRWSASIEEDLATSASSSPYSSPASAPSTPDTHPPTPLSLTAPMTESSSQVRSSLVAILSSSSAPDKWNNLSPALALQILRSTSAPLTKVPQFERFFTQQISDPDKRIYQEAESRVLQELFPILNELVDKYTPLTSLQIFEAATTPKHAHPFGGPPSAHTPKDEISEIANRIAHIGILHWRVWAPLAYLLGPGKEENQTSAERARSVP